MGQLIAIHGGKGSGKNTFAGVLLPSLVNAHVFAFGTVVKKLASIAFGVPLDAFYDEAQKERPWPEYMAKGMSPRDMMTTISDAMKRQYGPMVFANHLRHPWEVARRSGRSLLVTDLRHAEEADLVRHLGGKVVHILSDREPIYAASEHISESPLDILPSDFVVENNSTLVTLHEKAALFVSTL